MNLIIDSIWPAIIAFLAVSYFLKLGRMVKPAGETVNVIYRRRGRLSDAFIPTMMVIVSASP